MKPDRRAILRDAHRRYRRRLTAAADFVLSWAECLRRAWAAWRHRMEILRRRIHEESLSLVLAGQVVDI